MDRLSRIFMPGRYVDRRYKALDILGQGSFGTVYKCLDTKTGESVAMKNTRGSNLNSEASMLKKIMANKLDEYNIVKFYDSFCMDQYLFFELLDISLDAWLHREEGMHIKEGMRIEDIRYVIEQLAVAFEALKRIGVIHNDLKSDNIMLVDHASQPFRVKLVDFGLAIFRHKANKSNIQHGHRSFRAPEIMLALPISEAIDMWSLGCVMAEMLTGSILFPGKIDIQSIRYMIDILGLPPDHVLNEASNSCQFFFKQQATHIWKPWDYLKCMPDHRHYTFRSLDEVILMHLEKNRELDSDGVRECISLLKEMLKWDARERITPSEVLTHSFITRSYLYNRSSLSNCDTILESTSTELGPSQTNTPSINQAAEPGTDYNEPKEKRRKKNCGKPSFS